MRIIFFSLLFTCLFLTGLAGQEDIAAILQAGLPIVSVQTENEVEPTADFINAPVGCLGQSITNVTTIPAVAFIINGADTIYQSGKDVQDFSGATIKLRGNSSPRTAKKPYKIKLQKKADLLFRHGSQDCRDKNWLLLKEEECTLNTPIGFKVNELVGLPWTPAYQFVNVIINGDFKGLYMLCESVRRNPACRINVDALMGIIIENDAYWWNEDVSFASQSQGTRKRWTFKYPDAKDVTSTQVEDIRQAVNQLEESIWNGTYTDYLDTCTFAQWFIGHEILATSDGAGSNIFLTKYDDANSSKFAMNTMWDFDTSMKNEGYWANIHYLSDFYFPQLIHSTNRAFAKAYVCHWLDAKEHVFDNLTVFLDGFVNTEMGRALEMSRKMDQKRWNYRGKTIAQNVTEAKAFFERRKQWLTDCVEKIDTVTTTSIATIYYQDENTPSVLIDLQGRQVKPCSKGIFIDPKTRKRIVVR